MTFIYDIAYIYANVIQTVQILVNWIKSNHSIQARLKMQFHLGIGDMKTKAH